MDLMSKIMAAVCDLMDIYMTVGRLYVVPATIVHPFMVTPGHIL